MGAKDHREKSAGEDRARCLILSVSDTRTVETDESGKLALKLLGKAGHEVRDHRIVRNRASEIRSALRRGLPGVDLVVTIGGTGISARDGTVDVVRPMLKKELPGFGEMFRSRSAKRIGTAAILSRALLGVTAAGKVLLCTPGSPDAVRLALSEILLPELQHLLWELRRYS